MNNFISLLPLRSWFYQYQQTVVKYEVPTHGGALYCSFIGKPGGQKGCVRFPWDTRTTGKCVYQEKWTGWTEGKNTGGYLWTGREGMDGILCTIIASYAGEWTKEYKLTGFSSDGEGFHGRVFGKCHKCKQYRAGLGVFFFSFTSNWSFFFQVRQLNATISDKKSSLAPIIKELRPMRQKCQVLSSRFSSFVFLLCPMFMLHIIAL